MIQIRYMIYLYNIGFIHVSHISSKLTQCEIRYREYNIEFPVNTINIYNSKNVPKQKFTIVTKLQTCIKYSI